MDYKEFRETLQKIDIMPILHNSNEINFGNPSTIYSSITHQITMTLPSSASAGDSIAIKDYAGTFATNNLTIGRNSHKIQGNSNDNINSTNRASLVLVYVDSTKGWLYWEEHNVANLEKNQFTEATGGTVSTTGDFKIHKFTGDGCFAVSQIGTGTGPAKVDYLVVAGGGGSGGGGGGTGGGGNDGTISWELK